jgi:pimeloyl-ACP methyl ester carboxylesterase
MITYDLRSGLDIYKETFGSNPSVTPFHIDASAFVPLAPSSPEIAATRIARDNPLFLRQNGRRLVTMSMREDAEDITLFGMSWGANFEHPIGEGMVACIAHQFPSQQIVSWNAFGRGSHEVSSRIEPAALKHAGKTGSFDHIGREYGTRLAPFLEGKRNVTLLGVSEGARIMLSAIPHLGRKVQNVILLDGPGTLGVSSVTHARHFYSERKHSDRYVKASEDTALREFVMQHTDPAKRVREILRDARRGILLDHYYRSAKSLSKNATGDDLLRAAPYITHKLAFILPEYTRMNIPERVRANMVAVAEANPRLMTEVWSFPGTHAIINAGNMVEATLLAYATNH